MNVLNSSGTEAASGLNRGLLLDDSASTPVAIIALSLIVLKRLCSSDQKMSLEDFKRFQAHTWSRSFSACFFTVNADSGLLCDFATALSPKIASLLEGKQRSQ